VTFITHKREHLALKPQFCLRKFKQGVFHNANFCSLMLHFKRAKAQPPELRFAGLTTIT